MAAPSCALVLVLGGPGSGKTTLCASLSEALGWRHLDVGSELRALEAAGIAAEAGELLEDLVGREVSKGGTLLLTGFPRALDGLDLLRKHWPQARLQLALLLEASEDTLRARHAERPGRPESCFEARSAYFREHTLPVAQHFKTLGLLRYVDAEADRELVLQEAKAHLATTVLFVAGPPGCGKSALCRSVAEGRGSVVDGVEQDNVVHHISVGDLVRRSPELARCAAEGALAPSKEVVKLIGQEMESVGRAGRVFLLDGFPRCAANLAEWARGMKETSFVVVACVHIRCSQAVCLQRVKARVGKRPDDTSKVFLRRFQVYEEETQTALAELAERHGCEVLELSGEQPTAALAGQVLELVRGHLPLSIDPGSRAAAFLERWLAAAKAAPWTELGGTGALERYEQFLLECRARDGDSAGPAAAPDVWLCWAAHLLRTEAFAGHEAASSRWARVLRPPCDAVAAAAAARPSPSSSGGELEWLPAAVPQVAKAFAEALGMLDLAGLAPLGDPSSWGPLGRSWALPQLLAARLAKHYRRYLFAAQDRWRRGERMAPPMELDWLWHAHVLHGDAYEADCQRLFGRMVPHRPEDACEATEPPSAASEAFNGLLRRDLARFAEEHSGELRRRAAQLQGAGGAGVLEVAALLPCGPDAARELYAKAGGRVGATLAAALLRPEPPRASAKASQAAGVVVTVHLLSGDVVFSGSLQPGATLKDLRLAMGEASVRGSAEAQFVLIGDGVTSAMRESEPLQQSPLVDEVSLNMVLSAPKPEAKPKSGWTCPRCGQEDATPGPGYPCADCYGPNGRTNNAMCSCCSCFTGDCQFVALEGGDGAPRLMRDLQVGDHVRTGGAVPEYRRVTRIWRSFVGGPQLTVRLSPGCRLTCGHPVLKAGRWLKPEALCEPQPSLEDFVYTLELEGHVDTVLVGGVVCAALGVYCGEDFGWNVFTRKTVECDDSDCPLCPIAVDPGLDFSTVTADDMLVKFQPYHSELWPRTSSRSTPGASEE